MRVAVLGCGAIGGVVARALMRGEVAGVELSGVVHSGSSDPPDLPTASLSELLGHCDAVVECAGQRALTESGPAIVASGADLLVVSAGALAEPSLFVTLREAGPGRVRLCAGAIGGLDLLASAARGGGLDSVRIETSKKASALIQSWMDETTAGRIRAASGPVELARGPASEITRAFPASANVAASVALAVGEWHRVEAAVIADPHAELTRHVIIAGGDAGTYRFEIRNHPSSRNPATSAIVPDAVLAALARLADSTGAFA